MAVLKCGHCHGTGLKESKEAVEKIAARLR
jgi:2-methylisocitrate lyase-like PEP mutase family enzyme